MAPQIVDYVRATSSNPKQYVTSRDRKEINPPSPGIGRDSGQVRGNRIAMASDSEVGSPLCRLVSSKPGARLLELGTGIGLSLCWMQDGSAASCLSTSGCRQARSPRMSQSLSRLLSIEKWDEYSACYDVCHTIRVSAWMTVLMMSEGLFGRILCFLALSLDPQE